VVVYLIEKFKEAKLGITNIFRFADKKNSGQITVEEFMNAIKKLIINVDPVKLEGIKSIFEEDYITIEQAKIKFPSKNVDKNGLTLEQVYWLRAISRLLLRSSIQPTDLFKQIQPSPSGKTTFAGLKDKLIEKFSFVFKKGEADMMISCICSNESDGISQNDFIQFLSFAQDSDINYSDMKEYEKKVKLELVKFEDPAYLSRPKPDSRPKLDPIKKDPLPTSSIKIPSRQIIPKVNFIYEDPRLLEIFKKIFSKVPDGQWSWLLLKNQI
jgi:hypothetical protein